MTPEKLCTECGDVKPVANFYASRHGSLRRQCKECHRIGGLRWMHANPTRRLWVAARRRAVAMGLAFTIAVADIEIPPVCPVLGIPINTASEGLTANSPSVDRIVPALGYVPSNIAVISWRANKLKSDGTPEELAAIVRYCLAHRQPQDRSDET